MPPPQATRATEKELWTATDVADYFGISLRTLRDWRDLDATFPLPLDLPGRTLRWHRQDVTDWALSLRGAAR